MLDLSYTASVIQTARKEKGFTQEDLASRLGVTAQAVSKWERALSIPDIDLLLGLSEVLNVSIGDLLVDQQRPPQETSVYDIGKSKVRSTIYNDQLLLVNVGLGLVSVFTKEFIQQFSTIRSRVLADTGVLLPLFRIMDDASAGEHRCSLSYGAKTLWCRDFASPTEQTGADILAMLHDAVLSHLPLFVNRHMVKVLLENVRECLPFVVEGIVPERISLSQMKQIVASLVQQGKSVRNLPLIIDLADNLIDETSDITEICARMMASL